MARGLLVLLTFLVLAVLTPGQAATHHHAGSTPAVTTAPATEAADPASHPCGAPMENPSDAKACACPALCAPLLGFDRAVAPLPARRLAVPRIAPERDGIDRLPPVPPPRG